MYKMPINVRIDCMYKNRELKDTTEYTSDDIIFHYYKTPPSDAIKYFTPRVKYITCYKHRGLSKDIPFCNTTCYMVYIDLVPFIKFFEERRKLYYDIFPTVITDLILSYNPL